jgi:OOP family OmpA-OmpF porin
MSKMGHGLLLIVGAFALLAGPAAAEEDQAGCKDHPLLNRMPNHSIYGCDYSQFEMRRIPVGPLNKEDKAKLQEVEGEFWSSDDLLNEGATKASGLQIQRNFHNAAKKAGGTVEGGRCAAGCES